MDYLTGKVPKAGNNAQKSPTNNFIKVYFIEKKYTIKVECEFLLPSKENQNFQTQRIVKSYKVQVDGYNMSTKKSQH